ncbi:MAG: ribosomal RNA small subunit methyltransferase G [Alphaproteobacteria bacterium]|nr:MAG: ribosomal RNA small subunit methyltransferase G [Alphaproteobacteria bacterium]
MSDDDREAFLRLYNPVSRETLAALETYRRLLTEWQERTNLVGTATLAEYWMRHVGDSLQALALMPEAYHWIDLGSGAGFPGMVIAIAHGADPRRSHVLIDSNARKCAFLREVARATGAHATVVNERIESAAKRYAQARPAPQVVTARALAPLGRLLELAAPLLADGAVGLFHKGREYQGEIEDCRGLWEFDLVIHKSRIAAGSVLLEVRHPTRAGARR